MATYFVTGAAGFIGSTLARRLLADGHAVRGIDDFSTGSVDNVTDLGALDLAHGDVVSADLDRLFAGVHTVFHKAAIASVPASIDDPSRAHAVNVTGTVRVLEAARRVGVRRVVLASSSAVYGDDGPLPRHEGLPLDPRSPYAATKAAGEAYCRAWASTMGVETVCLRYFNVFGPRQDPNGPYAAVIPKFVEQLVAGQAPVIYGDGLQTRDFVYIDDVVEANVRAATRAHVSGGVFNVASGHRATILDLFVAIEDRIQTGLVPLHERPRPGDIRDSWADVSRARDELGFVARTSLVEGLAHTVDWFTGR